MPTPNRPRFRFTFTASRITFAVGAWTLGFSELITAYYSAKLWSCCANSESRNVTGIAADGRDRSVWDRARGTQFWDSTVKKSRSDLLLRCGGGCHAKLHGECGRATAMARLLMRWGPSKIAPLKAAIGARVGAASTRKLSLTGHARNAPKLKSLQFRCLNRRGRSQDVARLATGNPTLIAFNALGAYHGVVTVRSMPRT